MGKGKDGSGDRDALMKAAVDTFAILDRIAPGSSSPRNGSMDQTMDDPVVQRALALVLMREAMEILDRVGEDMSCNHLQLAVDTLLRHKPLGTPAGIQ
ncbi:hypothetical protein [Sphingomonas sp.]|uniref:hypothetical protein n=1 Tax=Sphingomonas sp. TaxID=28214 RepID=UPI00307FBE56